MGDVFKAKQYFEKAEELSKKFNDNRSLAYLMGAQGNMYLNNNEFEKAKEYYEKVLVMNKNLKEKKIDFTSRIDLSALYLHLGEIAKAKKLCVEAQSFLDLETPSIDLITLKMQEAQVLNATGNWQKALNHYKKALAIAQKIKATHQEINLLYEIGKVYLGKNQEKKAVLTLKRCLNLTQDGYDTILIKEGRKDLSIFKFLLEKKIESEYLLSLLNKIGTEPALVLIKEIKGDITKGSYDLEVRVLGKLELRNKNGKILEIEDLWRTQKAKALFIFLVLNSPGKVSRDSLIETFWPDKGLAEGAHCLHEHISYLRGILKDILGRKIKGKNLIVYQNRYYSLNPDIVFKIDIWEFEKLIKEAKKITGVERLKSIELYQRALMLYRGNFCEGLYDTWILEQRSYYRGQALEIAKHLGQYQYENGKYQESLELFRKAVFLDPADEETHLGIIAALAAQGDKVGVQKQYQILQKILQQELNITPSEKTRKIYEEIIRKL